MDFTIVPSKTVIHVHVVQLLLYISMQRKLCPIAWGWSILQLKRQILGQIQIDPQLETLRFAETNNYWKGLVGKGETNANTKKVDCDIWLKHT